MSIKRNTIEQMAELLGIDTATVRKALDSTDEHSIDLPKVNVFNESQLRVRDSSKYEEGKRAGEEIAVKEYKEENSITFPGKSIEKLMEYHKGLAGNANPDIARLQENVKTTQKEMHEWQQKYSNLSLTHKLHGLLPEVQGMNKAEALAIMAANGFEFKEEQGTVKVWRNGQLLKDEKLLTELPADTVIRTFWEHEKKMTAPAVPPMRKGRGEGNTPARSNDIYGKASEYRRAWETEYGEGRSNGIEFQTHLLKKIKEADEAGRQLVLD